MTQFVFVLFKFRQKIAVKPKAKEQKTAFVISWLRQLWDCVIYKCRWGSHVNVDGKRDNVLMEFLSFR